MYIIEQYIVLTSKRGALNQRGMTLPNTIGKLFFYQAQRLSAKTAVRYKQLNPIYQSMTWKDFSRFVEEIAFGLASIPIDIKKPIAIFSPTSYLWVAADLATVSIDAISVPIYPNSCSVDIEYILNNSEAEAIFVASEKLLNKLVAIEDKIPHIKKIIYLPSLMRKEPEWDKLKVKFEKFGERFIHLNQLSLLGEELAQNQPQLVMDRLNATEPNDIATIIYTSGTTGTPKGVPLTHANILTVLSDCPKVIPIDEKDVYFSYLPISHVFERVCGEYYWLYTGCTTAFAESIETMSKNLSEIEPTLMAAVPRVLDGIYNKMLHGINSTSGLAKWLIDWAIGVGEKTLDYKANGQDIPPLLKIEYRLADRIVLHKLRQRIGKRLRFIVCGGAPATPSVLAFFNAIGVPTIEGYGLTETAAPTNVNRFDRLKLGTVGPALPCVEMKIDQDGEVLFKGPSIFGGYFKNEEATLEAFVDGWFRTGDVGEIDEDGYLKITDRKKDLIVNAAGKNIAPQRIESILKTIAPISQAVVFGDRNKHLVALLTLDEHKAMELARAKNWQYDKYSDLAPSKELHDYLRKEVTAKRCELAEYECIKHFSVLEHDLSVDAGELTATLKIKRNVVAKKYADKIENLYAGAAK